MDRDELARATEEYGGAWGINHTRRLLRLVESLARGGAYDAEIIFIAAHLHDWGAYKPWARPDTEHVQRSVEVAGPWLLERGCSEALCAAVLECIAHHADRRLEGSLGLEAKLLHDADILDFLGAVGLLRDFSKNARDLRAGYHSALRRRNDLPSTLFLPDSVAIAEDRIKEMDTILAAFEAETFGHF